MIEVERLKEIVKAELGWVLIDKGEYYNTKNDRLYIKQYASGLYVHLSILQETEEKNVKIELCNFRVKTERELISLFRKYKKIKKALR